MSASDPWLELLSVQFHVFPMSVKVLSRCFRFLLLTVLLVNGTLTLLL